MNSDALNVNLSTDIELNDMLDIESDETEQTSKPCQEIDARRRLEEKLEELRLQRDLKEFDFDF